MMRILKISLFDSNIWNWKYRLVILTFCILFSSYLSAQEDQKILLTSDLLQNSESPISFVRGWKYHPGDSLSWAFPEYDDRHWKTVTSDFRIKDLPHGGWKGIGWFRLHLSIEPSLWNKPLGLVYYQSGASDIYLDGNLLYSIGKVGTSKNIEKLHIVNLAKPLLVSFSEGSEHVFAIRYSNFHAEDFQRVNDTPGFWFQLGELNRTIEYTANDLAGHVGHVLFFAGIPLAFALLHIMIFLFYPGIRSNLYYALFAGSTALIYLFEVSTHFSNSSQWFFFNRTLWSLNVLAVSVLTMRFIYSLFYQKLPRQFWVFLGVGFALGIFVWILPITFFYLFGLVSLAEFLRVIFFAILRKKDFAWIIGIGSMVFILTIAYELLEELHLFDDPFRFLEDIGNVGVLGIVFSMSVYLAKTISLTNRDLQKQLIQVRELSERTLEQERLAKEQEIKQKLLEAEVEHQAKELEGARKLEKALADLEKANLHLRETQDQLVQSEKMASLGMLVAGIAHEINTPVGAIQSMHDTLMRTMEKLKKHLEKDFPGEKNKIETLEEFLKIIEESNRVIETGTHRVTEIVKRLRSFARLDEAEMKESDIHKGLEDTLAIIHHQIKDRVKVNRNYGNIPEIICYPGQLNQVFLNLLINASHAIKDKGEITITTYEREGRIYVEISDTGVGISQEHIKKVFDPGFTTKGVGVGTGLGLSICYQIIQNHKGEIRVESEEGKGSKFTIILSSDLNEDQKVTN
jgi:signal transduction histidine kinase